MDSFDKKVLIVFWIATIIGFCLFAYLNFSFRQNPKFFQIIHKLRITHATVTAYCPEKCCNDQWAGLLVDGRKMSDVLLYNNICAVDPTIIPLGSKIYYNGRFYLAADVGGKIKGMHIDLLLKNHDETIQFGKRNNQTIFILK